MSSPKRAEPSGATVSSEICASVRIVSLCILNACIFGIINDQITVRICFEYFSEGFHKEMIKGTWVGEIPGQPYHMGGYVGNHSHLVGRGHSWRYPVGFLENEVLAPSVVKKPGVSRIRLYLSPGIDCVSSCPARTQLWGEDSSRPAGPETRKIRLPHQGLHPGHTRENGTKLSSMRVYSRDGLSYRVFIWSCNGAVVFVQKIQPGVFQNDIIGLRQRRHGRRKVFRRLPEMPAAVRLREQDSIDDTSPLHGNKRARTFWL